MTVSTTRFYLLFVLALLAAATLVRAVDPFFVRALRLIAFDSYQRLAPQSYDARLPVRIVDIDEPSLAKLGQWPWPRTKMRDLLLELTGKGAAVVGFDILFGEPDRTSVEEIVKHLPPAQADLLREQAAGEPSNDQTFAAALKATPSVLATSGIAPPMDNRGPKRVPLLRGEGSTAAGLHGGRERLALRAGCEVGTVRL